MTNLPILRSREQILGALIDGFLSRVNGVDDLSRNSVISQFIQAVAQNNFRSYADVISLIGATSVDRAVGEALQRIARDNNVPVLSAKPSTGKIDITDLSFSKTETRLYSGQPAPVAGSLTLYVPDASKFGSTGTIYIGRGTVNVEGPLTYTAVTVQGGGAYWKISLSPDTPTTKFHNIGEHVVRGQGGNRPIVAGLNVQTQQGSATNSVTFYTTADATIIDGEVTVSEVPITCTVPGPSGNVPAGAIQVPVGLPYNATVTNPSELANGTDDDSDEDIRTRIKMYEQSKSKGTATAIKYSAANVISPDELKRVQSAEIVTYSDSSSALVFDDGTGYEPLFVGSSLEMVIDSALGGEKELQLRQIPVAQARIRNNTAGPYPIVDQSVLIVGVGANRTIHVFSSSDFQVPGNATAVEVATSINNDYNLNFLATTANGETEVVVYPKDPTENSIQVFAPTSSVNANDALRFAMIPEYTIRLYKNSKPLYEDGLFAQLSTNIQALWSNSILSGDNLKYIVDGCPEIDIILTNADFQAINPVVSMLYSTSIDIWAQVLNNKMPGVTVSVQGSQLYLASNLGATSRAMIEITGGTLFGKMFDTSAPSLSQGQASDFSLNRQTSQLSLAVPLQVNDQLTAGSDFTRAKVLSSSLASGASASGNVWIIVDGAAEAINHKIAQGSLVGFTQSTTPTTTKMIVTATDLSSNPTGFDLVQPGDWLLVWANPTDSDSLKNHTGYWRIETAQVGQITIDNSGSAVANASIYPSLDRIVIVRSEAPIQQVTFPAADLTTVASAFQNQLVGVDVAIVGANIRLSTMTAGANGELFVMAVDNGGKNMSFPIGVAVDSVTSHHGFVVTDNSEASVPSFTFSNLGTRISDDVFTVPDYRDIGGTEFDFLEILDYIGTPVLVDIPDSDKHRRSFDTYFDDATGQLTLLPPLYMRNNTLVMEAADRFFLRTPYIFDSTDALTTILDGDAGIKLYNLPVSRRLLIDQSHSATTNHSFSASDVESDIPLSSPTSFYDFDFSNFLVMRQSGTNLSDGSYSLKISASDFGPNGDKIRVGFIYPQSNSQTALSYTSTISDIIDIGIVLPVGSARTANWDNTTSFSIAVVTVSGVDYATFTYRSGTQPNFTVAGLVPGDVIMISGSANFLPQDTSISATVTAVSPLSFTFKLPTGTLVDDPITFVAVSSIFNQSGLITVNMATPTHIVKGQRIGLWNTAVSSGSTKPFNTSYIATPTSATQFTVPTPAGVPGGSIQSASFDGNNMITFKAPNHGLTVGNVIQIGGVSTSGYNGTMGVAQVIDTNRFTCVQAQSGPIASITNNGRFDFQSYAPATTVNITSITCVNNTATVTTSANHGYIGSELVQISGQTVSAYAVGNNYHVGDIILSSGLLYKSLVYPNTGNTPNTSPTFWAVTTQDLSGIFTVLSAPTLASFTYAYNEVGGVGTILATGGTSVKLGSVGSIARSIGGTTGEYLQFGAVTTSAQQVVDFVASSLADQLVATLTNGTTGTEAITGSTQDSDVSALTTTGAVSRIRRIKAKQTIELDVNVSLPLGAQIVVSGFASGLAPYNGSYVVQTRTETVPSTTWRITVQSSTLASATAISSPGGVTFSAFTPYLKLVDGLNSVSYSDIQALTTLPQFEVKRPWINIPVASEELRFVAVTTDQLSRFWNQLIVTGLSNVAEVRNSEFGTQLQIMTELFGSSGSVQVIGGNANGVQTTIVGATSAIGTKLGLIRVPYTVRKGLVAGSWIKLSNSIRQNKSLGFTPLTQVKMDTATSSILIAGVGSFQTARSTTQDATSQIRVEHHGSFTAFISIGGTGMGLVAGGVQEGDWVRIRNTPASAWVSGHSYSIGDRARWNNLDYTSLTNHAGTVTPDLDSTNWAMREWSAANQGIFQVVRIFGDAFWVEGALFVEESLTLGDSRNLSFFTQDSAMPGDTFIVASDVLGLGNIGRYTVVDESAGSGSFFPTASRVYVTQGSITAGTASYVTLGGNFNQVTLQEVNPISAWKKIYAVGPGEAGYANILVDNAVLMNSFGSSLVAYITAAAKIGFNTDVNYGIDAYRYYNGLLKELNKVVYGDPVNPSQYPGVKAAGTAVDIKQAIVKRITIAVAIRVRSGVPFDQIRDEVRASIAGYVNSLGVGNQVSLSSVVIAAGNVSGVLSVVITSPAYSSSNDLIAVSSDEKPLIVNSATDIVVSVLGGE